MNEPRSTAGRIQEIRSEIERTTRGARSFLRATLTLRERRATLKLSGPSATLIPEIVPLILKSRWLLPPGRSASQLEELHSTLHEMACLASGTETLAAWVKDTEAQMKAELWWDVLDAYAIAKRGGDDQAFLKVRERMKKALALGPRRKSRPVKFTQGDR